MSDNFLERARRAIQADELQRQQRETQTALRIKSEQEAAVEVLNQLRVPTLLTQIRDDVWLFGDVELSVYPKPRGTTHSIFWRSVKSYYESAKHNHEYRGRRLFGTIGLPKFPPPEHTFYGSVNKLGYAVCSLSASLPEAVDRGYGPLHISYKTFRLNVLAVSRDQGKFSLAIFDNKPMSWDNKPFEIVYPEATNDWARDLDRALLMDCRKRIQTGELPYLDRARESVAQMKAAIKKRGRRYHEGAEGALVFIKQFESEYGS